MNYEEDLEDNLKNLNSIKHSSSSINDFITQLDSYKSELDALNLSLINLNEDLKHYDFLDYLYFKKSQNIINLGIVNNLIQQLKICKNEIDNPEYLNKTDICYKYLLNEGYSFINKILKKSVDILYMNDDFCVFTNLIEDDRQIKQMILWHRTQECVKKRMFYKGDLNVFYRMMIKQECFVWYTLFYKDFIKSLNNLMNGEWTLFERFLYSVLIYYFENEEFIDLNKEKKECKFEEFSKSVEVQDYVYDLILEKCYKEYTGDTKKVMEI
ncbi:uncharacterized protein VNE69_04123 [Vairimorpha necatrix]|uniref:Uncharacterized protein n=1 Tax=Vairimorpha necatrix TaxID=6039 RepID=A0AAX4JBD6_9MICR